MLLVRFTIRRAGGQPTFRVAEPRAALCQVHGGACPHCCSDCIVSTTRPSALLAPERHLHHACLEWWRACLRQNCCSQHLCGLLIGHARCICPSVLRHTQNDRNIYGIRKRSSLLRSRTMPSCKLKLLPCVHHF